MNQVLNQLQLLKAVRLPLNRVPRRNFWEYVNMMFNKPDEERIKTLGPDRACAEWVLRNGGTVKWDDGKVLADYNALPPEGTQIKKVLEIDATDCGISHYGFPHLQGCTKLSKIVLNNAKYIEDRAMEGLSYGKDTLTHLQVSDCKGVTDEGLKQLVNLPRLEELTLFKLDNVQNLEECKKFIVSKLNKCAVRGGEVNEEPS